MLFERIESAGLAHYSYLIADGIEAVVIDPRRDCDVYIEKAAQAGVRLSHILETHRNEDYVVGSPELAARTGAEIWHADAHFDYRYGRPAQDGQTWQVGRLRIRAMHSPGHTLGHMSYLLHEADGAPWMLFSGDALFAGEVGRVDFLGMERAAEMAGHLYDTIFGKFLPLGDHILLCPAHGAGSVCGSGIADRPWTTLGMERRCNPRLQLTAREAFVAAVAQELEKAPYFERMEEWNLAGAPPLCDLSLPPPLAPREFAERAREAVILDVRDHLAFCAAHTPGALFIDQDSVPSFAGWFLPYDRPILLVADLPDLEKITRYLARIGYDNVAGYLAGGMWAWHAAGLASESLPTVTGWEAARRAPGLSLDVRSTAEVALNSLPGARHIHVTHLPGRLHEIPRDNPIYVFCATGIRATTAASLLQRSGHPAPVVVLGGMNGRQAASN